MENRPRSFYVLASFFGLFMLILYGPTLTIGLLSFQGPHGGLTFPMQGTSFNWFRELFEQQAVGDIWGAFRRSLALGFMVMIATVVVSVSAALAFRKRFKGSGILFYVTITSLVIPSILVSLGVGLIFNQIGFKVHWATSGFGSQLTWTLPFGLLIMFAVFNRFDKSFEEAARDQGASPRQVIQHVVVPIIAPSLIGVALFGFTLSYDEFAPDFGQLQHIAARNLWDDHQCDNAGDLRSRHVHDPLFSDHHWSLSCDRLGHGETTPTSWVRCR